jgi:hypothetical protein
MSQAPELARTNLRQGVNFVERASFLLVDLNVLVVGRNRNLCSKTPGNGCTYRGVSEDRKKVRKTHQPTRRNKSALRNAWETSNMDDHIRVRVGFQAWQLMGAGGLVAKGKVVAAI